MGLKKQIIKVMNIRQSLFRSMKQGQYVILNVLKLKESYVLQI